MIPYSHQCIDESDIEAVVEVLKSDFLTQGPRVEEFERALADYCSAKYCVAFNSATTALYASCFALDLSKNDSFITTPISFVSTANAGVYCGAKPIFCDIEPRTGNMDVDLIESLIEKSTKLIIGVDYGGNPLRWDRLKDMAEKHGLKLIDDASHALGAEYKGKRIGSCEFCDITVFSFHPVKPITTAEGGAALTNDEAVYKRLLMFKNHGITRNAGDFEFKPDGDWYYEMQFLSFNGRISDMQAALGLSQLKKIDEFIEKRRTIAKLYRDRFKDSDFFDFTEETKDAKSGYHLLPILLKDDFVGRKQGIFKSLRTKGIGVQVHYIPIYRQPFYRGLVSDVYCPKTEEFYKRELSLPVYPCLTRENLELVFEAVDEAFEKFK
ncbi:UDP-4-amino-4,6-dideoxy-N-acetyl-beta-L-altrosamine transaminase [Hippea maritima]|uniref:UDP-4-keto-6-deoxy-N-acetylglucosamine 4-aminotransferase n=1 Tax=Hippea maritima (strain ATCC 700847 / DSM 10411 / MH2) TaxID=760142 RepID=F2LUJ9_HIPMA|nr:UDP-4-amino-4,6-dideoxy-N-acetyl-beta-L-altrosamine transaminase [Hippea maritima]AEA34589.1 UDP-4-keto-6-deoxy-N-acetylglucosamine 4-aminotransferase [Hippea maritima DSM 10411]